MFKLVSLPPKGAAGVRVTLNNSELNFSISSVLTKRNKEDADGERQYSLLNDYLSYKGMEFKDELFMRYQQAYNDILYAGIDKDEKTLPYGIVHPVIDLFDIIDIFNWLKHIRHILPPLILAETFDPMIESDERGSRVQTYLKDDFIELAALTVIIKAAILPIAHYAQYNSSIANSKLMAYILFDFIKSHKIYDSAPMVKLLGMVKKLIDLPTNTPEAQAIRVIEKMLARDEIPTYILARAVILRVSTATIVDDDGEGNIITKIYKYINTALKETIDTAKAIREKVPISTDDGAGGMDQESFVEAFRMTTEITTGKNLVN